MCSLGTFAEAKQRKYTNNKGGKCLAYDINIFIAARIL